MKIETDETPSYIVRREILCDGFLRALFTHFSDRDCLIFRLYYHTDLTLTQIVRASWKDIFKAEMPSNLREDLEHYCKINQSSSEAYAFHSLRGIPVNRTHLHQAFVRALKEMKTDRKLIPSDLKRNVILSNIQVQQSRS